MHVYAIVSLQVNNSVSYIPRDVSLPKYNSQEIVYLCTYTRTPV